MAGQWWTGDSGNFVSIEQKLAKSLAVDIGDKLTFTVGSQQFSASVSSIRKVQWDTMRPNFYMIFSSGTLDAFAKTYLTSFYLAPEQKYILNKLIKTYPSMTVFEVDVLLKQFRTILAQITKAIDYLLVFALFAGIMVLFAAIYSTLDNRIYHGAILRTLGANRKLLHKSHLIEFALLGLIASLVSVVICEIVSYCLYNFVLSMDYNPNWILWLAVPAIVSLIVGLTGLWGVRQVLNKSPMPVLRGL
jgi:putative ABC transport system permease protein